MPLCVSLRPLLTPKRPSKYQVPKNSKNVQFLAPKMFWFWGLSSSYLRSLFGVKRGLKLTHFCIFQPQIIYLFWIFREAILASFGTRNCTFLELLGTWYLGGLFGVKRGLKLTHFGIFWPQIMYLFGVFRKAILAFSAPENAPFWSFQALEAFLEL